MIVKALFLFAVAALLTFSLISIVTSSCRKRLRKKMDKGKLTKDEWYDI